MIALFRRFFAVFAVFCLFVLPCAAYDDTEPADPPFVGSCFITADTDVLGTVDIYIPVSYQTGYFGLDSSGSLFNVSNSTVSGVLYDSDGTEYTFRCSSWAAPQYRDYSGSSYSYYDLGFVDVISSNVQIAEEFPPLVPVDDIFPAVYVLIGGVIVLCLFLKRF